MALLNAAVNSQGWVDWNKHIIHYHTDKDNNAPKSHSLVNEYKQLNSSVFSLSDKKLYVYLGSKVTILAIINFYHYLTVSVLPDVSCLNGFYRLNLIIHSSNIFTKINMPNIKHTLKHTSMLQYMFSCFNPSMNSYARLVGFSSKNCNCTYHCHWIWRCSSELIQSGQVAWVYMSSLGKLRGTSIGLYISVFFLLIITTTIKPS